MITETVLPPARSCSPLNLYEVESELAVRRICAAFIAEDEQRAFSTTTFSAGERFLFLLAASQQASRFFAFAKECCNSVAAHRRLLKFRISGKVIFNWREIRVCSEF